MKILLIEDETPAANRLQKMILALEPEAQIIEVLDSVEASIQWFDSNPAPDLVFLDIHLADGESFEIFEKRKLEAPVIFTTAYSDYAIRAFSNGNNENKPPPHTKQIVPPMPLGPSSYKGRTISPTATWVSEKMLSLLILEKIDMPVEATFSGQKNHGSETSLNTCNRLVRMLYTPADGRKENRAGKLSLLCAENFQT